MLISTYVPRYANAVTDVACLNATFVGKWSRVGSHDATRGAHAAAGAAAAHHTATATASSSGAPGVAQ